MHANHLPIEIEVVENDLLGYRSTLGIVDGVVDFPAQSPVIAQRLGVPVVAVQSVKGGTGRTTTAAAIALRWAERARRPILLVDADLEAPGLSYLFKEVRGEPRVSLEDAVVLAHSEETPGAPETVKFVTDKLKDHQFGDRIIILPVRRDLDKLASSGVRPEHLVTANQPFALADLLSAIGHQSGCVGVVVDVRAGLVPIGVNLGLDPDVVPVFVTTLSSQALKATAALYHFLTREIRRAGRRPRRPLLVVNRVPTLFQHRGVDNELLDPLISGIVADLVDDSRNISGPMIHCLTTLCPSIPWR